MDLVGRIGSWVGGIACGVDVIDHWGTEAKVVYWFWGEEVMDNIG
jgi:hypothetical protein